MSALRVKSGTRSLQNLVLEGHAFGIVFPNHFAGGIRGGEHLDVLNVTDLLACVDLDKTVIGSHQVCACREGRTLTLS